MTTSPTKQYSTYLQNTTKPDYHSSSAASVANGSPSSLSSSTSFSPLGKSSYVQQMWFHGAANKLSKGNDDIVRTEDQITHMYVEELSKNIAAMIGDEAAPEDQRAIEENAKISLLVGEIAHTTHQEGTAGLVHSVKLSNICSPRTIVSGPLNVDLQDLRGKKVIVVTNLPLRDTRGVMSEGMLLCSHGVLVDAGTSKVGTRVKLLDRSPLLSHLEFSEAGYVQLAHGTLEVEGDQSHRINIQ